MGSERSQRNAVHVDLCAGNGGWQAATADDPDVETFDSEIGAGDSSMTPDAVTHWVARELRREFNVDVEDYGIDVVDPTDEEVTVL